MLFSIFSKQFAITSHISTTYTFHLSFRNLSKIPIQSPLFSSAENMSEGKRIR